ncbi:PTS galactitol transporter subunit IIC, partial [Listeria welshimeri]|nr:PTS galactitol transporter subunit IIC [Listeria welshimeri]
MDKLLAGVQYVLNLGPTVILPIMIFFIALIFRVPAKKAVRSAITIGIGFVGINLLLILMKATKTLDIDIWNYWHFIAAGATGYIVTGGSWWFAILCAIIYEVLVLWMADKTQHMVEDFYGLKGISLPTGSTAAFGFVGIPIGWLIAKIP